MLHKLRVLLKPVSANASGAHPNRLADDVARVFRDEGFSQSWGFEVFSPSAAGEFGVSPDVITFSGDDGSLGDGLEVAVRLLAGADVVVADWDIVRRLISDGVADSLWPTPSSWPCIVALAGDADRAQHQPGGQFAKQQGVLFVGGADSEDPVVLCARAAQLAAASWATQMKARAGHVLICEDTPGAIQRSFFRLRELVEASDGWSANWEWHFLLSRDPELLFAPVAELLDWGRPIIALLDVYWGSRPAGLDIAKVISDAAAEGQARADIWMMTSPPDELRDEPLADIPHVHWYEPAKDLLARWDDLSAQVRQGVEQRLVRALVAFAAHEGNAGPPPAAPARAGVRSPITVSLNEDGIRVGTVDGSLRCPLIKASRPSGATVHSDRFLYWALLFVLFALLERDGEARAQNYEKLLGPVFFAAKRGTAVAQAFAEHPDPEEFWQALQQLVRAEFDGRGIRNLNEAVRRANEKLAGGPVQVMLVAAHQVRLVDAGGDPLSGDNTEVEFAAHEKLRKEILHLSKSERLSK